METEQRRINIGPTPADFASDEAIEDFAARLWQALSRVGGIHMATQMTHRYAEAVTYVATDHLGIAVDIAKGSPLTRRYSRSGPVVGDKQGIGAPGPRATSTRLVFVRGYGQSDD